mmetsp:Transcript_93918/g.270619  ORF Transcript_93918/g.270619 Transcript_93918/m.270619 type:complete len:97 (-) Transcript_93918:1109-1399(-)
MVRNLATSLCLFLFRCLVTEASHGYALSQELTCSSGAYFCQTLVGIPYASLTECTHAECYHHAVKQDHCGNVSGIIDGVLQMRHEQQITGFQKAIV